MLGIVFIITLVAVLYWGLRSYLSYREAYSVYIEKCEYIKANEQAFVDFSEYCLSLVENDQEDIHLNDENLWEKNKTGKL